MGFHLSCIDGAAQCFYVFLLQSDKYRQNRIGDPL